MYRILKGKTEAFRNEILEFTRALVQTRSPNFQEKRGAGLVAAQLIQLGYDRVIRDDSGNVLGICFGSTGEATPLFGTQMDTVPAAREAKLSDSHSLRPLVGGSPENDRIGEVGRAGGIALFRELPLLGSRYIIEEVPRSALPSPPAKHPSA